MEKNWQLKINHNKKNYCLCVGYYLALFMSYGQYTSVGPKKKEKKEEAEMQNARP